MHASFPQFSQDIQKVMSLGADTEKVNGVLERIGGSFAASGMAMLLKVGFGFILRDSLLGKEQADKAQTFFDENFITTNPEVDGGIEYYQGKFLIRTSKPEDDMNVWFRFCPDPDRLYRDTPFGKCLDPDAVVAVEVLNEDEARQVAADPDKVDLVISFKDVETIIGLVNKPDADIAGLLLENLVQVQGNVGHMFKFGAIGKNIEIELGV
jgi:hypothetical protein